MKKLLSLLCTLFLACTAWADSWTDPITGMSWIGGLSNNGTTSSIGGEAYQPVISRSASGALTVPSTPFNRPLRSLGWFAFYECSNLTSICVPEGVRRICEHSFADCASLQTVKLPSTVTFLGYNLFRNCTSLTQVYLPSGVRVFERDGYGLFSNCPRLQHIYVDGGVNRDIIRHLDRHLSPRALTFHVPSTQENAWRAAVDARHTVIPRTDDFNICSGFDSLNEFSFSGTPWRTDGNSWYGGARFRSGDIGDNGRSSVFKEIDGPTEISFLWKVSSEQGGGLFKFLC